MTKAAATGKKSDRRTCDKVFRQMCDTLGADIASPECKAMRAHVEGCHDCTAYLESLKTTVTLYTLYPTPKLTVSATKKLLKALPRKKTR